MSSCKPEEQTSVSLIVKNTTLRAGSQSPHVREMTGEQANIHKRTRAAPNAQNTCRQVLFTRKNFVPELEVPYSSHDSLIRACLLSMLTTVSPNHEKHLPYGDYTGEVGERSYVSITLHKKR